MGLAMSKLTVINFVFQNRALKKSQNNQDAFAKRWSKTKHETTKPPQGLRQQVFEID